MVGSHHYANRIHNDDWLFLQKQYNLIHTTGFQKIPKKIHQIWLGGALPPSLLDLTNTIKDVNSDYEYKLWNESDIDDLQYLNRYLYNQTNNLGQRSDIVRYAILKQYGGIYLDTDFYGVKSFDSLLHLDFFTGIAYDKEPTMFNGLIGSTPNNDLITEINNIPSIQNNDGMDVIRSTGPWYMTRKILANRTLTERFVCLPIPYFYPYPNFQQDKCYGDDFKKYIIDETICVHLWHSRWN
jgi:mannosyltransferase OCH1-like enzyme